MTKTYVAPTVTDSGNVIRETLIGSGTTGEPNFQKRVGAGNMGFYL